MTTVQFACHAWMVHHVACSEGSELVANNAYVLGIIVCVLFITCNDMFSLQDTNILDPYQLIQDLSISC